MHSLPCRTISQDEAIYTVKYQCTKKLRRSFDKLAALFMCSD